MRNTGCNWFQIKISILSSNKIVVKLLMVCLGIGFGSMKRLLTSFVFVTFLSISLVFASASSITVQASPYSYQFVKYELPIEYSSQYGWGAKVAYRYNCTHVISLGADLSFSGYKFSGVSEQYLVLSALAKVALILPVNEKIDIVIDVGGGADLRILNSRTKINPTAGFYFGFEYKASETVGIAAGGDLRYSWQTNSDSLYNSNDFAVMTELGVKINL